MTIFQSKYINTEDHAFIGMIWPFRGCRVEMLREGFSCDCKSRPQQKCNHIKSVEFGILGVNAKEYSL